LRACSRLTPYPAALENAVEMNKQKTNENMKSTKTWLVAVLAAGALLGGSSALYAQNATNTPPASTHGGMKSRQNIAKQLDLTEDQKPKYDAIMKGAAEKGRALREDTSLTSQDKKDKAKVIREDTTAQLKALLTPEQFTKWQELSKHGSHAHPPGSPDSSKSQTTPPSN
jgi:periplasmic protein CpxP/Spy